MLWNYKSASVIVNIILILFIFHTIHKNHVSVAKDAEKTLYLLLIIWGLFAINFIREISFETITIFVKITGSFLMFLYGVIYSGRINDLVMKTGKISMFFILFFFLFSFAPYGYVDWGGVYTYCGLYFFKTDMALAIVIFLSFALISPGIGNRLKILLSIVSLYIVFITNARIHLLTVFFVIGMYIMNGGLFVNFKKKISKFLLFSLFSFAMLMIVFQNVFTSYGFLTIDLNDDFYSDGNTQGRNIIWGALLIGYLSSSFTQQLFGLGLVADSKLVSMFSDIGHNAHNSYFFILISIGAMGLVLFILFLQKIFSKLATISKHYQLLRNKNHSISIYCVLNLCLIHIFVFLITGLTNSTLMFQQQTWFFMFFSGYLFNKNLHQKISVLKNRK
jgi:hypothetical protein